MDAGNARPFGRGVRWAVWTLAVAAALSASWAGAARAPERVALVIGNGAYEHVSFLENPGNDARAVGEAFERPGYAVTRLADAGPGPEVTKPPEWAPGKRFRDCAGCPEMVVVPSGDFRMGSPGSEEDRYGDEGPAHRVEFARPFAVGVYEVTRAEFARFVSSTGRSMGNSCRKYEGGEWGDRSGRDWRDPGFVQTDGHPAVCVDWNDAKSYVRWLSRETGEGYRLLSESEWEYVARAKTKTSRYWGESEVGQCGYANGADREAKRRNSGWTTVDCDDGYYRTAPVGSFRANDWELHDVLGNVWEWVEDCWNESYRGAPNDGSAWESGDCDFRVLRGGSWLNAPRLLRSAYRDRVNTGFRSNFDGFRVARTLD